MIVTKITFLYCEGPFLCFSVLPFPELLSSPAPGLMSLLSLDSPTMEIIE